MAQPHVTKANNAAPVPSLPPWTPFSSITRVSIRFRYRLYQRIVNDLNQLPSAVGLKLAA
jgi:hypothetical protein